MAKNRSKKIIKTFRVAASTLSHTPFAPPFQIAARLHSFVNIPSAPPSLRMAPKSSRGHSAANTRVLSNVATSWLSAVYRNGTLETTQRQSRTIWRGSAATYGAGWPWRMAGQCRCAVAAPPMRRSGTAQQRKGMQATARTARRNAAKGMKQHSQAAGLTTCECQDALLFVKSFGKK